MTIGRAPFDPSDRVRDTETPSGSTSATSLLVQDEQELKAKQLHQSKSLTTVPKPILVDKPPTPEAAADMLLSRLSTTPDDFRLPKLILELRQVPAESLDVFMGQIHDLAQHRAMAINGLTLLAKELKKLPAESRDALVGLAQGRDGPHAGLIALVRAFGEVPKEDSNVFAEQIQRLAQDRIGDVGDLISLIEELKSVPAESRDMFVKQIQGRPGEVSEVCQFISALSAIPQHELSMLTSFQTEKDTSLAIQFLNSQGKSLSFGFKEALLEKSLRLRDSDAKTQLLQALAKISDDVLAKDPNLLSQCIRANVLDAAKVQELRLKQAAELDPVSLQSALDAGQIPKSTMTGTSGSFFLRNQQGNIIAVFKPMSMEPGGYLNNRGKNRVLRSSILPGQCAGNEVIACALDQALEGRYQIPQTYLVALRHAGFGGSTEKEIGSVQKFLPNTKPLSQLSEREMRAILRSEFDRLNFKLISGGTDAHFGNFLYDPKTLKLGIIDSGLDFLGEEDFGCMRNQAWITLPQASQPMAPEEYAALRNINVEEAMTAVRNQVEQNISMSPMLTMSKGKLLALQMRLELAKIAGEQELTQKEWHSILAPSRDETESPYTQIFANRIKPNFDNVNWASVRTELTSEAQKIKKHRFKDSKSQYSSS